MPEAPRRTRRTRLVMLSAAVSCLAVVGGTATWFFPRPDVNPGTCENLLKDKRVQKALGSTYNAGMSCSELGEAVKKATGRAESGQHSLRQAQAMKDVLVAVEESLKQTGGHLDDVLRLPLAESLADYAADTHVIFDVGNAEYFRNGFPSEPVWEDSDGVHMAVLRSSLLRTVRAISEDPRAYVTLRTATTQYAAEGLAAVPRGVTGDELTAPPSRNSHVLGTFDAVAADIRRDLGQSQAAQWERNVFEELAKETPEPPSYSKDPVNHLVDSWRRTLLAGGAENSSTALEEQSADMVDTWGKSLRLDSKVQSSLRKDSLDDSYHARSDALRELD